MVKKVTATKKSILLDEFLNELCQINTGATAAIQTPDGEVVEVPMMIEGTLLDYDSEFLLVGQSGRDALELVRRESVIGIKQISENEQIMELGPRPPDEELN